MAKYPTFLSIGWCCKTSPGLKVKIASPTYYLFLTKMGKKYTG